MRFVADHVIQGIPLARYRELYFDERFNEAMCAAIRLGRQTLKFERDGSRIVRHVRVEPEGREIPRPVAKVLGTNRFAYVEELEMDLATGSGTWRVIPALFADKVQARGTLRFLDAGPDTRRVAEGDVEVRILGIGGIIERFICADAEKSYAEAAAFTRRYVASASRGE